MILECFIFTVITFLVTGTQCEVTEVFAEEGSEAVLPCKSSLLSATPAAIVWSKVNKGTVWRKQKSGLQYWGANWSKKGSVGSRIKCPHYQFERGDYSLQINNLMEEDGGIYSCNVELYDKVVQNLVILRIIKVTVYPSVPIWGREVSVTCDVTPLPYGSFVRWFLNNSPFGHRTQINSDRDVTKSVVREKATARLTGNWTCVVSWKGKEWRSSATVSVKGIIQPSEDNTKVYAAVGSAVMLPCVFSTGLTPSSPDWDKLKPGVLPPSFSKISPFSQFPWDRSASLKEVAFDDQGRYRCSGTVQGERQTRTVQLVVAKIDRNISSKKKGSVTLTCQLSDTSEVTVYEWVRVSYDLNGTQSVETIQKEKTQYLSISKESEGTQGEWACRFYGKEGLLGNVTHHIPMMSALNGKKSTHSSYDTAAVVGLSFLLVVLLLILAQMYKNHQRRKRILQYPALETIVHSNSNEREERERTRMKK